MILIRSLLIFVIFSGTLHAQQPEKQEKIHWYTIAEAMELQKANPKKIFRGHYLATY